MSNALRSRSFRIPVALLLVAAAWQAGAAVSSTESDPGFDYVTDQMGACLQEAGLGLDGTADFIATETGVAMLPSRTFEGEEWSAGAAFEGEATEAEMASALETCRDALEAELGLPSFIPELEQPADAVVLDRVKACIESGGFDTSDISVSVVRGVDSGALAIETQHTMSIEEARTYGATLNACLEAEVGDHSE